MIYHNPGIGHPYIIVSNTRRIQVEAVSWKVWNSFLVFSIIDETFCIVRQGTKIVFDNTISLEDKQVLGDLIHEIPIVTDNDKYTIEFGQVFFQRCQSIEINVICLKENRTRYN